MDRQNNPEAVGAQACTPLTHRGMLGAPVQAGWEEFGRNIERRIMERTGRRIRQLRVEVCAGRVMVQGLTLCYYAKQLALLAVQEALREAGATPVADVRITVSPAPGRGRRLFPV